MKGLTAKRRGPTAANTRSHKATAKKTTAERVRARRFCSEGGNPAASNANQVNAAKNVTALRKNGHGIPTSRKTTEKKQEMATITNPG